MPKELKALDDKVVYFGVININEGAKNYWRDRCLA